MLGGGRLQMAFLERGALDEIEIYVASALLGGGYPLFPATGFKATDIFPATWFVESSTLGMHRLCASGGPYSNFVAIGAESKLLSTDGWR